MPLSCTWIIPFFTKHTHTHTHTLTLCVCARVLRRDKGHCYKVMCKKRHIVEYPFHWRLHSLHYILPVYYKIHTYLVNITTVTKDQILVTIMIVTIPSYFVILMQHHNQKILLHVNNVKCEDITTDSSSSYGALDPISLLHQGSFWKIGVRGKMPLGKI